MDEIKAICIDKVLETIYTWSTEHEHQVTPPYDWADLARRLLDLPGTNQAELIKDRDYWQALAMQFHDAVHAEIERRAKVEI